MFFNSLTFAIFLPIVFLLYWFVFQRNLRLQNLFVIAASYVFYGWWDWHFLFLIAFTTLCSYWTGLKIQNSKLWLIFNVVLNLVILGIFKYYNFFVESFVDMFLAMGVHLQARTLNIILPVGISFYTFQALSYSIDVYRKKIEPTRNLPAFAAYIGFFPLLVAGPIERATNMLPQFLKKRNFDYNAASDGMRQILWGLFKKIVIADNCAMFVNQVFGSYQIQSGSTLAVAAMLFAFQLYGDFSGYSDIAIGTARLFGINAMRNFNYPYFATSFADYWKRNHISLTTWFMDYVYYPLIGNSSKLWYWNLCMIIAFLLSGLWHGAAYTFVVWGLYQGVFIVLSMNMTKYRKRFEKKFHLKNNKVYQFVPMILTFMTVCVGLVFFRAQNVGDAFGFIGQMFSRSLLSLPQIPSGLLDGYLPKTDYLLVLAAVPLMLVVEWIMRNKQHGLQIDAVKLAPVRWLIYLLVIFIIWATAGATGAFIYFQF